MNRLIQEAIGFTNHDGETWMVIYDPLKTRPGRIEDAIWRHYERPESKMTHDSVMTMLRVYREGNRRGRNRKAV